MPSHRRTHTRSGGRRLLPRLLIATLLMAVSGVPLAGSPAAADSFGRAVMAISAWTPGGMLYSGDSVTYGTPVTLKALVWDISSSCSPVEFSCDPPRGTVELSDNGVPIASGTLQPRSHKESAVEFEFRGGPVADLVAGRHEFSARYSGDFDPVSAAEPVLNVTKAPCAISISQSSSSSAAGDEVEFVADLGSIGHRGVIRFDDPLGLTLGESELFFGAVGRLRTTQLPVGTTDLRAVFPGDENHQWCASWFVRHVVHQRTTSTAVTSSLNPATYGDTVTFRAAVSGGAATPTGTVTFRDGGSTLATVPLVSGVASFSTSGLSAGTHHITALYGGDPNHSASSGSVVQHVSGLRTTTVVAATPAPSVAGQTVTLRATVTGSSSTPTGAVRFYDGGAEIATSAVGEDGVATLATDSLAPGIRHITASYLGDDVHAASFGTVDHTVSKVVTGTALTASPNPSVAGGSVVYTARVSPSTAGGAVEFRDQAGIVPSCGAQPVSNGIATCSVTYPTGGTHRVVASYAGSPTHDPSSSDPLDQVVERIATTTTLTVPAAPTVVDQPVVYRAAVSPGHAAGTVMFRAGGVPLAGCSARPVIDGEAECTVTWPAPGHHVLVAELLGDPTFAPSVSDGRPITVTKAPTQLTADPASYPTKASVTVSARSQHTGTGAPIGGQPVEFLAGTKPICTTLTDATGVAPMPWRTWGKGNACDREAAHMVGQCRLKLPADGVVDDPPADRGAGRPTAKPGTRCSRTMT